MKHRIPGNFKPVAALVAAFLVAGTANADNYVGTSAIESNLSGEVGGVTSGSSSLNSNSGNTQIYSGTGKGIYLLSTGATTVDWGVSSSSTGVMMAVTATTTTINSTATSVHSLLAQNISASGSGSTVTGQWDFTGATVTGLGLGGSFDPAQVTTAMVGGTGTGGSFVASGYSVDLVSGAAALGATTTNGITNTGNIATGTLSTTGLATLDSASITHNATIGGTLAVTGATALNGATTVNNTLNVNGATTIVGTTHINTTGTAATTIGNSEAPVSVTGSSVTTTGGATRLTLNDNGATFSNATTGAPTRVTGVANGTGDFDAVNVRQFSSAVAGATAAANIPGVDTNKTTSVGVGMGSYMNSQALAFGGSYRFSDKGVLRASLATGLNTGGNKTSFGVGAGWSW